MLQGTRFVAPPAGEILHMRDLPATLERLFAGFETYFAAAGDRVDATIGGDPILAATTLPSYAETVRRAWADDALGGARHAPACRILVARAGVGGMPALPRWGETRFSELAIDAALEGTQWRLHYLRDYGFWQIYDHASGRGVQLMRDPDILPPWDSGSPLRNFLHWHFMRSGRALIHAGTLGLDGEGLLLAGTGGSGKSGTVLAGVMHGLQTVGDDYVLASRTGGFVAAAPIFRTLKQDPVGFARLGLDGNAAIDPSVNWQGKRQFTLDAITDAAQPASLRIRALCLPAVAHVERTSFHPVSAKEAFLALAPSGVAQMPGDRAGTFAFCAALSRLVPAYRMMLGTEPAEIADAVAAFLREPPVRC